MDDADRRRFLETLGEACARTGWHVHAFVLMGNHDHFMIETPQANLVAGMRWFQTAWTMRYNRRHGLCGHLFQGRYQATVVDAHESRYFPLVPKLGASARTCRGGSCASVAGVWRSGSDPDQNRRVEVQIFTLE